MPLPVRSLPVVQNWDCGGCAECCRSYHIPVSEPERARIESQKWGDDPDLAGLEPFVHDPQTGWRLNHRAADDACVFLGPDNRCRIHAKFGATAKPRACRIYPFVLVPAGDHWRVGIKFACPASVEGKGRPLPKHVDDLREYAGLLEADAAAAIKDAPPPDLQPGQSVPWPDLLRFVQAIQTILADRNGTLEHRLRRVIALASLCRKSRFDAVRGSRLKEFLELVSAALDDDVVEKPETVAPPGWIGRMVFRQVVAVYSRKDWGLNAGVAKTSRWTRIVSAWRFARGKGRVPKLHAMIPNTTFQAPEQPTGPLGRESEELLRRYFLVKVESLQFCGAANFGRTFWDGLDSLILTFPAILWLSRVLSANGAMPRDEAVKQATRMVDDNFGFNKLLGADRQTWAVRTLSDRGELAKLVAWYAR